MQIDAVEFQALITYYMKKRGLTGLNQLSERTMICYKTLLKYWKDPEKFPLGEVGRILDSLRIPQEEFMKRVFITNNGGMKSEAEEDYTNLMHCSTHSRSNQRRGKVYDLSRI